MTPADFKRWRKSLGYSQRDAADALGLKRRVVQYYEKGERDGKTVDVPLSVRLACQALTLGVTDYHGPQDGEAPAAPTKVAKDRKADTPEKAGKAEKGQKADKASKPEKPEKKKSRKDDGTKAVPAADGVATADASG